MTFSRLLYLFGIGYFVANMLVAVDLVRYWRRARKALVTWPGPPVPLARLNQAIGVALSLLIFVKLVFQHRPPLSLFGEAMMLLYYGYALWLRRRIRRGLYADGVWTDRNFMPWETIEGASWRDAPEGATLVLLMRGRPLARTLAVPGDAYGAVRRLLRDKVVAHDIRMTGGGLDLGAGDGRDAV